MKNLKEIQQYIHRTNNFLKQGVIAKLPGEKKNHTKHKLNLSLRSAVCQKLELKREFGELNNFLFYPQVTST